MYKTLLTPELQPEDSNPSSNKHGMPVFGGHEHLTDIRHIHYDPEAEVWATGLIEPRPLLLLGLTVNREAYQTFRNVVPRPNWNRRVPRGHGIETFFHTYTRSNLDIVTCSTASALGIRLDSLIPPSDAGVTLFNLAMMPLRGSFFARWSYDDPVTRVIRCHNSVVYVAEASDDHVSLGTMHSLMIRRESTFSRAVTLYIPQNQN